MYINRLVAALTPVLFAPAAGFVTAYAATHLPGLPALDATQVTALFAAGATIAFGKAALWMHGWHLHMQSPDGQVGRPADDDEIVEAHGDTLIGDQHPEGSYDPDAELSVQPHSESNGRPVLNVID
jgi:hypothetical protein